MIGLGSIRASIPRGFPYIVTLFVFLAPFYCQLGLGYGNQSSTVNWNVPAKTSAPSELQVGDLYAVVVGVSKYKDARIPALSVSDKDARSIAEFLKTQKNLFKDIHVSLLVNQDATNEALQREFIYKLRKAGKDDTVIVFLSGHGVDDPKNPGEFFFLPYDADPEFVAIRGVHMNRQWFTDRLDSKRVLIIADACHAGGFAGSGVKRLPPSLDKFMSQFKESQGRVFITSSRSDEYSKEKPELGHSLFTHYLLEGLGGKAADQDGVVTLKALYDYVYKMTKKASDGFQSPQMEGKLVGNFPVALVRSDIHPVPQVGPQKPTLTVIDQDSKSEVKSQSNSDMENVVGRYLDGLKNFQEVVATNRLLDESEKRYQTAISLKPQLVAPKIGLADVYMLQGRYPLAVKSYDEILKSSPGLAGVIERLSEAKRRADSDSKYSGTLRRTFEITSQVTNEDVRHLLNSMGFKNYTGGGISRLSFNNIIFEGWSSAIRQGDSITQLDEIGKILTSRAMDTSKLVIETHANAVGPFEPSMRLSNDRARAVKDYLVSKFRVAPHRIIDQGFGFTRPKYDPATNSLNRRVDFVFVNKEVL